MAARPRLRLRGPLLIALVIYLVTTFIVLTRPGAALSDDQRTVIRIAHWQIEAGPREAISALIKRYEELNPKVRVEQVAVPGNVYKQWLRTQLIGGNATDIIEFGSFIGGVNDIPPRFFDPISSYVEEPNPYNRGTPLEGVRWRDTFKDGLDTPDTYIENLSNYYAVTLCMLSMRLFYNPHLLQQVSGSLVPPKTYDELLALGAKLRERNAHAPHRLSLLSGSQFNGYVLMSPLLARTGLGLSLEMDRFRVQGPKGPEAALEFLRGEWSYHRPELLDGIAMMRQIAQNMRPGFQQLERDAAIQEFLRGQSLMIVTGVWDATSIRRLAPFEVGVTEFPWPTRADGPIGRYCWTPVSEGAGTTSMPLYLNKASKHKEQAIDFLRFITSIEGNTIFVQKSGWLPSIRDVEVPDYAKVYLTHLEGFSARTDYMRGFGTETRDVWERQLHHLISPQGSVEEFVGALDQRFPAALRSDVQMDARNIFLSLRRDQPSLTALAVLDRLQHTHARETNLAIRESSQNLTEARLYETLAVLKKGRVLDAPAH